jgi:hypothetical protein
MLHIGWASRDITPKRPAIIPGQMHMRIGREAVDPLTLNALALDGGTPDGRAILISCDITNVTSEVQETVTAQVQALRPELAGAPVVLNATHTHDGFLLNDGRYGIPDGVMSPAEGRDWLIGHAVAAAVAAWDGRRERRLGRAFAHAVVGHNRRAVYADGLARMYGRTDDAGYRHIEGYEDHSLDLLLLWEADGRLAGLVIDLPCPSQADEHLERFSADFWHDIRVELRARLGPDIFVLPLCGAAGDQSPHLLLHRRQDAEMRARSGRSRRQDIAVRVADAVCGALATTPPMIAPVAVACASIRPHLPGRTVTLTERAWAAERLAQWTARGDPPELWWPSRLREVIAACDQGRPMPAAQPSLHLLRLGDAVIATNPFELYLDYGLQIKARSPAAQTLLVQLAGGAEGYLASPRSIRAGDYGSHPASSPIGEEGGQILVEATLAAIATLFPEAAPA